MTYGMVVIQLGITLDLHCSLVLPITQCLSTIKSRVHKLCCFLMVDNVYQVGGEKMYDKARRGETVELSPRRISIYQFDIERSLEDRFLLSSFPTFSVVDSYLDSVYVIV